MSTDQNSTEDSNNKAARTVRDNGGFYHHGRFVTMRDVIENYDSFLNPSLTSQQNIDLIAYLKSF